MPTPANDMKIAGGILVALILIALSVFAWMQYRGNAEEANPNEVGGARDEKGCLTESGYVFDDKIGACVRISELNDNTRRAAETAVRLVKEAYGLTLVKAEPTGCEGCYSVTFERGTNRTPVYVRLSNWVPMLDK